MIVNHLVSLILQESVVLKVKLEDHTTAVVLPNTAILVKVLLYVFVSY